MSWGLWKTRASAQNLKGGVIFVDFISLPFKFKLNLCPMLIKRFLLSVLVILLANQVQAQHLLSGFVKDRQYDEVLVGTVVKCVENDQNTATNNYGYYSLALPNGRYTIVFIYPGYKNDTLQISLYTSKRRDVGMTLTKVNPFDGESPTGGQHAQANIQPGTQKLPSGKSKKLPLLLGEVDVVKAAQLLPGIKSGTEGSSGLYVRGGGRGQNLLLLDGTPVYNQNHLFGFFSTFNGDAINSLQLYKGSFPARFGGRLSSVVDVTLKEGNTERVKGTASIGALIGRLALDGPLGKSGKTTFAISGRRSYIDLLINPFVRAAQNDSNRVSFDLYFYDLNAKISHKLDDRRRIYLSFYQGKDKFGTNLEVKDTFRGSLRETKAGVGVSWKSSTAALRYAVLQKNNIFANYSLSYSRYKLNTYQNFEFKNITDTTNSGWFFKSNLTSKVDDISLLAEYDYKPSQNHHLRYGASSTLHLFTPGLLEQNIDLGALKEDTVRGKDQNATTIENALFLEDVMQINKGTSQYWGTPHALRSQRQELLLC